MPKQKVWILSAAGLIVVGLAIYGGISLTSKMDQVKELNTQIADVQQTDEQPGGEDQANEDSPEETGQQEPTPATTDSGSGNQDKPAANPDNSPGPISSSGNAVINTPSPSATPKPNAGGEAGASEQPQDNADKKAKRKQEIDASTTTKMEGLRATCSAKSSSLVAQIKAEIKGNEDAAVQTIQEKFLTKVIEAEAECDAKFNQLVEEAKAQYDAEDLDVQSLPDWSAEYETAKTEARSAALVEIANAISS